MKRMITLICVIGIFGCDKPEKKIPDMTPSPLEGTWVTTSLTYKAYENGVKNAEATVYPPFDPDEDAVEAVKFSGDFVTFMMYGTFDEAFKYTKKGDKVLISDGGSEVFPLNIDKLTGTEFDFSYSEIDIDPDDSTKYENVYEYKTIKD